MKMGVNSSNAINDQHAPNPVPAQNRGVMQIVNRARLEPERVQVVAVEGAQTTTSTSVQTRVEQVNDRVQSPTLKASKRLANSQSNGVVWCLIKSKTRQHNSAKESKQSFWFEARSGSVFTIGRDQGCDLRLEDDRCERLNARIVSESVNGKQGVFLHPESRMYRLIGMRGKQSHAQVLSVGAVIKVGSISLEVTDLCTDENDDFADRFAVEIGRKKTIDTQRSSSSVNKDESSTELENKDRVNSRCESAVDSDGITEKEEEPVKGSDSEPNAGVEDDDAMCYICWMKDDEVPPAVEKVESISNTSNESGEQPNSTENSEAVNVTSTDVPETAPKVRSNPLIRNPCGNCSGGSRYVHLQCLLTWIKKSGSGHCSICNGVLPAHFASPPPNIELKIVRHRRGHSWVGTRRFRLSFADVNKVFIGKRSSADVRLPDRSVGDLHAKIKFDRKNKQFLLSDNNTSSGTFLQIAGPLELGSKNTAQQSSFSEFKIGRTNLTIKIAAKRSSVLNMIQFPSWPKRSSPQN